MLPRPHLIAAAIAATVIGGAIGRHRRQKIERAHPPAGNFQRTSKGLNLHYVEAGRGHPVVLLHGATSQLQDMTASLMPRLSLDYHVIAFDRPGHGYSDRLPYRAWAEAQAHAIQMMEATLGFWILALLLFVFVASLPLYPYSRAWGYRPGAAFLALLLIVMVAMWLAGIVWWPWSPMHESAT